MRTWKAIVLFAAAIVACDDPVGLVTHDDAGISGVDTGPAVPSDASTVEDVGVPDTGPVPDTGLQPDAEVLADAGEAADAATLDDVGVPDTGFAPDANELPDTGADWDGGGQPDVGMPPDAAEPGLDASGPRDAGSAAIGQPCADAFDCATGDTCLGTADGWPAAGACSQSGCNTNDPVNTCPAGSRCRNAPTANGWAPMCLDLCTTDGTDPCAAGLTCTQRGPGGNRYYVCEP